MFSVEFLPGQFDQRADSAEQCVQFIKEDEMRSQHGQERTELVVGQSSESYFKKVCSVHKSFLN